jgi:uncharacterized membrane protein
MQFETVSKPLRLAFSKHKKVRFSQKHICKLSWIVLVIYQLVKYNKPIRGTVQMIWKNKPQSVRYKISTKRNSTEQSRSG